MTGLLNPKSSEIGPPLFFCCCCCCCCVILVAYQVHGSFHPVYQVAVFFRLSKSGFGGGLNPLTSANPFVVGENNLELVQRELSS